MTLARWRILSREYSRVFRSGSDTVIESTKRLLEALHGVLLISGAHQVPNGEDWKAAFQGKVRDLIVQCMAIKRAICEDNVSSGFQIICFSSANAFSGVCMENMDNCGRGEQHEIKDGVPVLCTTELGLRRCEQMADNLESEGNAHVFTLTKAKVVLHPVSL